MFRRMFDRWASNRQVAEAEDFLARIRPVDGDELGLTVAMVLHMADIVERNDGVDLFEPASVLALDPNFTFKMSGMAIEMQKEGDLTVAAAVIIWVHSLRGTSNFLVRPHAREIWGHLKRGFPHADFGAQMIYQANGTVCNLRNLGRFPTGLSPDVR